MKNIQRTFWGVFIALTVLWLLAEPSVFQSQSFFALRGAMVQYSGVVAMGAMSVTMVLALRPRWPERWFGGLDKMYRLHKWLGIAALILATLHWLWAQGPKWAVGWGLLERPARGGGGGRHAGAGASDLEAYLGSFRHAAEGIGEWAFYASVLLIVLALIKLFPYRLFYKTHRLLAVTYLVLVFHTVVLMRFSYWASPIGWASAILLACGTWAAIVVLIRKVGADRQVQGQIMVLQYYPGVHALETDIDVPQGWPGHKPGQFAFVTSDSAEGAHPYTIASCWSPASHRITFITKELGDHTNRLRETLKVGQQITIEGPYGCFTFDDNRPCQIWVGGGIGVTPFVARMKQMAMESAAGSTTPTQTTIHLFHTSGDIDETAFAKLAADAKSANVQLHLLIDSRHGLLTGQRIRDAVPEWRKAGIWFCGPAGFGDALRRDLAANGFAVDQHFHQELFAMR